MIDREAADGRIGEEMDMTDSLRRHYPVRFSRSADPLTHSALSAHHVV